MDLDRVERQGVKRHDTHVLINLLHDFTITAEAAVNRIVFSIIYGSCELLFYFGN